MVPMDQQATTVEPMPQDWRIQVVDLPAALPDQVRAAIDRHWASVTAAGRPYWNGPALAIAQETKSDSQWRVELHRTDYAHYLATLHRQIDAPYWCRVVAVGGLLITADGQAVLGENAPETVNAGELHCIGGGIEVGHADQSGLIDPQACMAAELREETGLALDQSAVGHWQLRWLVTEGPWGFRFPLYAVHLTVTTAALADFFETFNEGLRAAGRAPEIFRLVAVPADSQAVERF